MKATNMTAAIVTMTLLSTLASGCGGGGGKDGVRRSQVATGAAVGTTVLAGALVEARVRHQATALQDGAVLITGGQTLTSEATSTAELWQAGQTVPLAEAMAVGRRSHTSVLLPTGEVWIAGGVDARGALLGSTEVWSPTSRSFRPGPSLREARGGASICKLDSGIVLAGGGGGVEVWGDDLTAGASFALPDANRVRDRLVRVEANVLYLAGGVVLGADAPSTPLLIDLDAGAATPAPGATQVAFGAPVRATLDGTTEDVFVVGGTFGEKPFTHLQRVRAGDAGLVQVLPDVLVSREQAAVVALGRGILVAGGVKNGQVIDAVELVVAEGSSFAAPLRQPRFDLIATTLTGGSVLFTGGRGQDGLPVALTELLVPPGASAPDGRALFDRARQERAVREALQAEVVRLQGELKQSEDALTAERAKTARLEQELAVARARIADLEAKVASLEAQVAQLQASLATSREVATQRSNELAAAQNDLAAAKQRELFLQLDVNGGKETAARLESEKDALAQQIAAEQAKAAQAAQQAASLQGQVTTLRTQLTQPAAAGARPITTRRVAPTRGTSLGFDISNFKQN